MNLYITRHGVTDWNVLHKVQGRVDTELNQKGREQAYLLKEKLDKEPIDLILSSPLKRAMQTASIIAEGTNVPVLKDERIIERDFGEFEGKVVSQSEFETLWSYEENKAYETAENIRDLFERIENFLDEMIETYSHKNILLVVHGGIVIPMNCYFKKIPKQSNLRELGMKNCEFVKYEVTT